MTTKTCTQKHFELRADGDALLLTAARPGDYRVFWSRSPDGFSDDNELGALTDALRFTYPTEGRCYCHITDRDGGWWVAATREADAGNTHNLRELGGYLTADGRRAVKYGQIYRCDALAHLEDAGIDTMRRYGIRTVLDFRGSDERERRPDPAFDGVENLWLPVFPEDPAAPKDNRTFEQVFAMTDAEKQADMDDFERLYRQMPFIRTPYRALFRLLLEERTPLLFHCAAGKDRTGIAALLILLALGVPEETAVADYDYVSPLCAIHRAEARRTHSDNIQSAVAEEHFQSYFAVAERNVRAALDEIHTRYPDLADYFRAELALSAADLARLQELYLTEV